MLVIAGTFAFDPSEQDGLAEAIGVITAATRAEAGCVDYRFAIDAIETGRLHVFEHWESDAAWQAHMTTPHVAAFSAAIAGVIKDAAVNRYDVTTSGPLFPRA